MSSTTRFALIGTVIAFLAWPYSAIYAAPVVHSARAHTDQASSPRPSVIEKGNGSYYADTLHGRRTASGEPLDQNDLTAASRDLPLGAHAKVTNINTGKSVNVRINDRGPYAHGRVIDLSKRAAKEIDIDRKVGVAPVKVEASPSEQPTQELRERVARTAIKKRAVPESSRPR